MITLQLQPEIEAHLVAQASAEGEEVAFYIEKLLRRHLPASTRTPRTPAEQASVNAAIQSLRDLRKGNFLNGITTKDLVEEGRKY